MQEIKLLEEDKTFFAKCPNCCRTGIGVPVGWYFSKAYTRRQWERHPVCDNCQTVMKFLYEVT